MMRLIDTSIFALQLLTNYIYLNNKNMNKRIILTLAISGIIAGSTFTASAQTPNKKVTKARAHVVDAKKELAQAKKDSALEYQQFKTEANLMIASNKKTIAELKAKKAVSKQENNEKYNKKLADLEKRNMALQNRVNNYKAHGNTNWMVFKSQYHEEMKKMNDEFKESRD